MSANVNLEQTLQNLGEIKSSLDSVQMGAKKVLQSSDVIREKAAKMFEAGAEECAAAAEYIKGEAGKMLEGAETLIVEAGKEGLEPGVVDSLSNSAIELTMQAEQALMKAQQYASLGEEYVKQAQEFGRTAADGGWPDMLVNAGIGFSLVFVVLVLLIFIMAGMGLVFTRKKKADKVAKAAAAGAVVADDDHHEAITDQEIAAAIITALKLYKSNLHDQESEMLTIHRITRAYSPWSSKIHGLTQLPERK